MVDSQADHRSPDMPAAAAAAAGGSTRPDRVVDLADIPSSTLMTMITSYKKYRTRRRIILLRRLLLRLTVVIFVGHEINE